MLQVALILGYFTRILQYSARNTTDTSTRSISDVSIAGTAHTRGFVLLALPVLPVFGLSVLLILTVLAVFQPSVLVVLRILAAPNTANTQVNSRV